MAVITKIEHFKPAIFEAGIRSDVNCKGTTKISLIFVQGLLPQVNTFPDYRIMAYLRKQAIKRIYLSQTTHPI